MNSSVWVSAAAYEGEQVGSFDTDLSVVDLQRAGHLCVRHKVGEALAPDDLPHSFYSMQRDKVYGPQPDYLTPGGFHCVSARCAAVLRGFDLGQGQLQPVRLFQYDRATPVPGEYWGLNVGAVKRALRPEASRARKARLATGYFLSDERADDDIAVGPEALEGADWWADPLLIGAFFVSGRLADALRAAGLARPFALKRCRAAMDGSPTN